MYTLATRETPVMIHAPSLDPKAQEQIRDIAGHPALKGLIAIMPDAHAGMGCVIGFTGRFDQAVIPNIVGVDIGCGVASCPLPGVERIDFAALDSHIRERIPLGMVQREDPSFFDSLPAPEELRRTARQLCEHLEETFFRAERVGRHLPPLLQLCSLGGGNHFIEIDRSETHGGCHLVLHSGSRNLGKRVAEHFQAKAAAVTAQMGVKVPRGLEYLPLEAGGSDYLRLMKLSQAYARHNRRFMLATILAFFGLDFSEDQVTESVHNYIAEDDGVIRKGAIRAHEGERVIIPLNMAEGTLLGRGRGKTTYNCSAPHGAGRKHGRREMFRMLDSGDHTMDDFAASMTGIFTTSICRETFDESRFAYKDLADIEPFLAETVEVTDRLKPIYNLKAAGE